MYRNTSAMHEQRTSIKGTDHGIHLSFASSSGHFLPASIMHNEHHLPYKGTLCRPPRLALVVQAG